MFFLFHQNSTPSNGKRLTGFPRYTEVLDRCFVKFLFTNFMTLIGFLPFWVGATYAVFSSSLSAFILACIIGGAFAGPALACMYDAVLRSLRDVSGKCWAGYKHAWKQNWRQSLLPGILFCFLLGFYIYMPLTLWQSARFSNWGTIALYLFSLLLFTMCSSICWPQIALFEQPFRLCLQNSLLLMLRFFPKIAGIGLLQILYWAAIALFLPWSAALLPLAGFWFILYTVNFLIYDILNKSFKIEEKIADAFPEQTPFYEDDEAWLKRKQAERNTSNDSI